MLTSFRNVSSPRTERKNSLKYPKRPPGKFGPATKESDIRSKSANKRENEATKAQNSSSADDQGFCKTTENAENGSKLTNEGYVNQSLPMKRALLPAEVSKSASSPIPVLIWKRRIHWVQMASSADYRHLPYKFGVPIKKLLTKGVCKRCGPYFFETRFPPQYIKIWKHLLLFRVERWKGTLRRPKIWTHCTVLVLKRLLDKWYLFHACQRAPHCASNWGAASFGVRWCFLVFLHWECQKYIYIYML